MVEAVGIGEAFDGPEQITTCGIACRVDLVVHPLDLERVEKLSMGALPWQLPLRLMDEAMPAASGTWP